MGLIQFQRTVRRNLSRLSAEISTDTPLKSQRNDEVLMLNSDTVVVNSDTVKPPNTGVCQETRKKVFRGPGIMRSGTIQQYSVHMCPLHI